MDCTRGKEGSIYIMRKGLVSPAPGFSGCLAAEAGGRQGRRSRRGPQELRLAAGNKGTPRVAKFFHIEEERASCSWRGQPTKASVTLPLLAAWQHCLHLQVSPS